MVQLLLEVRVFFLQFPLQGAFAVLQLCGHIFNGALPAGEQLYSRTADTGGIGGAVHVLLAGRPKRHDLLFCCLADQSNDKCEFDPNQDFRKL